VRRPDLGLGLAALLLAGGCAAPAKRAIASTPAGKVGAHAAGPRLQEQAAAIFDAAVHNDQPRLKLAVDWSRYRTLQAWLRAHASHEASTGEVSLLEAEPDASESYINHAVGELQQQLADVAKGPTPPQPRPGVANALFGELKRGVPQTKYPALPRLWELTSDAIGSADEVTYEGARAVTLLFIADRLVGVLEAR
jgi:hypothetical protein